MHDGLASLLAEGILKILAIVLVQEVSGNGLSTVLVDSLKHLVAGGVAQTGEQGDELLSGRGGGRIPEDDLVQLAGIGNLESRKVNGRVRSKLVRGRGDVETRGRGDEGTKGERGSFLRESGCSSIAWQWCPPWM